MTTKIDENYESPMEQRPLVGVSSCLLGHQVRYDGGHKFQSSIQTLIAPRVRLLPFCPESAAGLGIPRPPVNLVRSSTGIRALGRDDPSLDVSAALMQMGRVITSTYPSLCGYIVQSRSPSCGFQTTPVFQSPEQTSTELDRRSGLFVEQLLLAFPGLPIISDTELTPDKINGFLHAVSQFQAML